MLTNCSGEPPGRITSKITAPAAGAGSGEAVADTVEVGVPDGVGLGVPVCDDVSDGT